MIEVKDETFELVRQSDCPSGARMEAGGWTEIGRRCKAGRRSLWMRIGFPGSGDDNWDDNAAFVELRAGREGDDAYVRIGRDQPQFAELLDVLLCAKFAAET